MSESATRTYNVPDISCDHCVNSITDKVSPIEGVEHVTVDLATKSVTVIGGNADEVTGAIAAAGYQIA